MEKSMIVFCFVFANFLCIKPLYSQETKNLEAVVVTQIIDGDTLQATLLSKKKNIRIRLADIDCPEKSKKSGNFQKQRQTWQIPEEELIAQGKQAKEKLKALIDLNAEDIYFEEMPQKVCNPKTEKRTVGVLWTGDGVNINDYMLRKAACRPYSCPKE